MICGTKILSASAISHKADCILDDLENRYSIALDARYDGILGRHSKKAWTCFVKQENEHLVSQDALDFLDRLLRFIRVRLPVRFIRVRVGLDTAHVARSIPRARARALSFLSHTHTHW